MTETSIPQVTISNLSHSDSSSSISSLSAPNIAPPCCFVCKEEVDVFQEAKSQCIDCNLFLCARDAAIHRKKEPSHQVIDFIGSSSTSLSGSGAALLGQHLHNHNHNHNHGQNTITTASPMVASTINTSGIFGGPAPLCLIHHIPINTFCGSCKKLVCSACAIEEHREGHGEVNMISKIEPEERANLEKVLQNLRDSMKEWESLHKTHDSELEEEGSLIEKERNRLKEEVASIFDHLRQSLQDRQDQLNADIDEICKQQTVYTKKIIDLKKVSVDYMAEFDKLAEMSGFELMDRKLGKLPQTLDAFEDLKTFFKYLQLDEVHDIQLTNVETMLKYVQREISQLGEIVKTPPKTKSTSAPNVVTNKNGENSGVVASTVSSSSSAGQLNGTTTAPTNGTAAATVTNATPFKQFSMKFEHAGHIGKNGKEGSDNESFKGPWDVKVSHNCGVIIVSDSRNNRIQFFDLKTKEYKATHKTPKNPRYLAIEPNFEANNDALIYTCDNHCVYKYNLRQLVTSNEKVEPIWTSGKKKGSDIALFNEPAGVIVCTSRKINQMFPELSQTGGNTIFVCDGENHRVKVLKASDGKPLKSFGSKKDDKDGILFHQPEGIYLSISNSLVITEYGSSRVHIVGIDKETNEFVSLRVYGKEGLGSMEFNNPRGIAIDETLKNVIVCDGGNNRITFFNLDSGSFTASYNGSLTKEHFGRVVGSYFDDKTGELYLSDYTNSRIVILK